MSNSAAGWQFCHEQLVSATSTRRQQSQLAVLSTVEDRQLIGALNAFPRLFGRPYYRSRLWHNVSSVCRLSVSKPCAYWVATIFLFPVLPLRPRRWPFFALCIVAKRYVLAKNCLKERIKNQGQKVDFGVAAIFLLPVSRHRNGRFCLNFAPAAQQSVLDVL